jgi:hypothetical protein
MEKRFQDLSEALVIRRGELECRKKAAQALKPFKFSSPKLKKPPIWRLW